MESQWIHNDVWIKLWLIWPTSFIRGEIALQSLDVRYANAPLASRGLMDKHSMQIAHYLFLRSDFARRDDNKWYKSATIESF